MDGDPQRSEGSGRRQRAGMGDAALRDGCRRLGKDCAGIRGMLELSGAFPAAGEVSLVLKLGGSCETAIAQRSRAAGNRR